jgi:hypothetical protein
MHDLASHNDPHPSPLPTRERIELQASNNFAVVTTIYGPPPPKAVITGYI